jgi:hypothetical protein
MLVIDTQLCEIKADVIKNKIKMPDNGQERVQCVEKMRQI